MSKNIEQVYVANPITSNASTDLMYFGQSPYAAGDDAAMTFNNFKAQLNIPSLPLSLANGGTGASLTASTNSLVYGTGSGMAFLASANSGILTTSSGGVPSIGTALPNGITATTQSAIDNSTKIATTAYVDRAVPQGAWSTYVSTVTSGIGTLTTVGANGRYQIIGKTVTISVTITIVTNGTGAGSIVFTLPVNSTAAGLVNYVLVGRETAVTGVILQGLILGNASTCTVWTSANLYPGGSGYSLTLTGVYESA